MEFVEVIVIYFALLQFSVEPCKKSPSIHYLFPIQFQGGAQATDCTNIPDNFKPWECCHFPQFNTAEIEKMKKTLEELNPDKIKDFSTECVSFPCLVSTKCYFAFNHLHK